MSHIMRIESDAVGVRGKVIVDGVEVQNTCGVDLRIRVGELVEAKVHIHPTEVIFEGGVEVLTYVGINGKVLIEKP